MDTPVYRTARLDDAVWQQVRQLTRELSAALADDLTQSQAIGVAVRYALANPETITAWEHDQRTKGSDH